MGWLQPQLPTAGGCMTVQKQAMLSNNNRLLCLLGLPGFMVSAWPDSISKQLQGRGLWRREQKSCPHPARERARGLWQGDATSTLGMMLRSCTPGTSSLLFLLLLMSIDLCCGNSLFPTGSPRSLLRVFCRQTEPAPGMTYTQSQSHLSPLPGRKAQ